LGENDGKFISTWNFGPFHLNGFGCFCLLTETESIDAQPDSLHNDPKAKPIIASISVLSRAARLFIRKKRVSAK